MKLKKLMEDIAPLLGEDNHDILLRCANLVMNNVANNYGDFIEKQTFNVKNGKITYGRFKHNLLKIKSVKSGGREIQYDLFIGYICVPCGKVEVEYACVPRFKTGNEQIPGGLADILAVGIMKEYSAISDMREADTYAKMFEKLMYLARQKGKSMVMPC